MRTSSPLPLPKMKSMHLQIEHHTEYQYDNPVRYSIQELRLSPLDSKGQTIVKWKIQSPVKAKSTQDTFGNVCQTLVLDTPYKSMSITAKGEVKSLGCYEYQDDAHAVSPYYLLQPTTLTQISEPMRSYFESALLFTVLSPPGYKANVVSDLHVRLSGKSLHPVSIASTAPV